MKKHNLIGQVYGRLTVTSEARSRYGLSYWECLCECGKITEVAGSSLKKGVTKSCGCLRKDIGIQISKTRFVKHGDHKTRLYQIWNGMLKRCYTQSNTAYPKYGGKGIRVCDEWREYLVFKEWALSHGYQDDLTIDRKDSTKNYEPDNCRWATYQTQLRNRTKTVRVTSSKYIGVSKRNDKWIAYLTVNKKINYLGLFDDELAAAKARDNYIKDNNLSHFKLNL